MINEDVFYISYDKLVPGMTEDEYLNSVEEDSPFKRIVDEQFDKFFAIPNEKIEEIAKSILPDISVLDVYLDVDGAEVPLPSISINYESDNKLDKKKFVNDIVNCILTSKYQILRGFHLGQDLYCDIMCVEK